MSTQRINWIYKADNIPTVEGHKGKLHVLCCIGGHDDWYVSCSCGWKMKGDWFGRRACMNRLRKHMESVA